MKITAVAQPSCAHHREAAVGTRGLAWPNPMETPSLSWVPKGDLARWHGCRTGKACKKEKRDIRNMRLVGGYEDPSK
jgi:hypothetical protein